MHRKAVGFSNMYAINIFYTSLVRCVLDYAFIVRSPHKMSYTDGLNKSAEQFFLNERISSCYKNSLDLKFLTLNALNLMSLSFVKF